MQEIMITLILILTTVFSAFRSGNIGSIGNPEGLEVLQAFVRSTQAVPDDYPLSVPEQENAPLVSAGAENGASAVLPGGAGNGASAVLPGQRNPEEGESENNDEAELHDHEPFIPEGMERVIIGNDDRITINNTNQFPYSAIALMRVGAECGCGWQGSGFMAGKNCLLTAAHCLVCPEHSTWANDIDLYFGYKSDSNYYYHCKASGTMRAGTVFPEKEYRGDAVEQDYGIIFLDEPVGERTGCFGLKFDVSDEVFEKSALIVCGYRDGLLKWDYGRAEAENPRQIRIYADGVAGNSGCPIYDSENYAYAIYTNERFYDNGDSVNVGRRLNSDIREGIHAGSGSGNAGTGQASGVSEDKLYYLVNVESGLVLDIYGEETYSESLANVQVYQKGGNGNLSQLFRLRKAPGGWFSIIPESNPGLAVNPYSNSPADGSNINAYPLNPQDVTQGWYFYSVGDYIYNICSAYNTALMLTAEGSGNKSNVSLHVSYQAGGARSQQWKVVEAGRR